MSFVQFDLQNVSGQSLNKNKRVVEVPRRRHKVMFFRVGLG